jgi:HD-GYP domain-containing protein (c-di-GMP phosphodiesterase class II)
MANCAKNAVAMTAVRMRLAELVATMSFAGDTGMGLPDEAALRSTVLAVALAEEAKASPEQRGDAFWISLLRYAGCTADAHLNAAVFEDEIAVHKDMYGVDWGDPGELMRFLIRRIGNDRPLPARVLALATAFARMPALMDTGRAHCEVGDRLAQRFGLPASTRAALFNVFERWDGTGLPKKVKGPAIPLAARIASVAQEAEVGHRLGGAAGAAAMVRRRSGKRLDPELSDLFARRASELCARLEQPSIWATFLASEEGGPRTVDDAALDEALQAMGDFADLQSRFTRGHSASVASLAREAAEAAHLTRAEAIQVERAALVHDVGRVAVSAGIWDAPRALTDNEWERVRLHPHATERIFARVEALAPLGELAALAHERLEGKGYCRRLSGSALSASARLLAACDSYAGMTQDRPHRQALAPARAAEALRAEAKQGRLDGECVEAVLGAAGHKVHARAPRPGALSDREVEVIRLLARGLTNKEIASALNISTKTAGNHVQHVFEKAGVTTRAAAAMFAMHHGLV